MSGRDGKTGGGRAATTPPTPSLKKTCEMWEYLKSQRDRYLKGGVSLADVIVECAARGFAAAPGFVAGRLRDMGVDLPAYGPPAPPPDRREAGGGEAERRADGPPAAEAAAVAAAVRRLDGVVRRLEDGIAVDQVRVGRLEEAVRAAQERIRDEAAARRAVQAQVADLLRLAEDLCRRADAAGG